MVYGPGQHDSNGMTEIRNGKMVHGPGQHDSNGMTEISNGNMTEISNGKMVHGPGQCHSVTVRDGSWKSLSKVMRVAGDRTWVYRMACGCVNHYTTTL